MLKVTVVISGCEEPLPDFVLECDEHQFMAISKLAKMVQDAQGEWTSNMVAYEGCRYVLDGIETDDYCKLADICKNAGRSYKEIIDKSRVE